MAEQMIRLRDRLHRVMAANERPGEICDMPGQLPAAEANKRKAPRKRSCLPAYLKIDGRHRMINCKVMDMSATGACLKILHSDKLIKEDVLGFPDILTLFITFDKVSISCQIAWRMDKVSQIGVRFLAPAQNYS